MILDSTLEFCDAIALNTGGAGEYLLGSQIDLTVARDVGQGEPLYLVVSVDTTATSGGSAKVRFKLASDATAAVAVDGTATEHVISHDIAVADLTAGKVFIFPLPSGDVAYERFLGIIQETLVAAFTAGKINAFLTREVGKWKSYADATN